MANIRFDGVINDFFDGGFKLVKGFLTLKQIVNFNTYESLNDTDFQRAPKDNHSEEIKDYLTNKPHKILPDIIFSIKTDYAECSYNSNNNEYYYKDNLLWEYREEDARYKGQRDNGLKTITIYFKEGCFNFIDTIDGNHRLRALKSYYELHSSKITDKYKLPVTFILNNTKEKEKAFFYYLNGKSKPLLSSDYINILSNTEKHELRQIDETLVLFKEINEALQDLISQDRSQEDLEVIKLGLFKITHELAKLNKNTEYNDFIIKGFSHIVSVIEKEFKTVTEFIHILYISMRIYINEINSKSKEFQEVLTPQEVRTETITLLANNTDKDATTKLTNNNLSTEHNITIVENTYKLIESEVYGLKEWQIKANIDFENEDEKSFENISSFYKAYMIYKKTFTPSSRKIFIAMPFNKQTEATYFIIKDIIHELNSDNTFPYENITLVRVDKEVYPTSEYINDVIMSDIEKSDLMIADLTGHNRNVYYELGYKAGIDKTLKKRRIIVINDTANLYCDNDRHNKDEKLQYLQSEVKDNFSENYKEQKIKIKVKEVNSLETAFDIYTLAQIRFKDYGYLKTHLAEKLRKYYSQY
ncbi:MAG: hypothetical protein DRG78_13950 [Epsilonproteobacteria bacterium]|nr:MAG: hypothetical protein DRG78_13950 [Campylobacterota bacterium]